MILQCGWGKPPAEAIERAEWVVNGSRIMARRKCQQFGALKYDHGVETAHDHSGALYFGSAWHDAMDRMFAGVGIDEIVADYRAREWVKPADETMFEHGLKWYGHYYNYEPANGVLLGSEQSFWMLYEVSTLVFLVLGRFDRLCNWRGELINGEIKTVDPRRKFDVWYTMRANSIQDALYNYALVNLPKTLPNGVKLPERTAGTRYDIFFKKAYPNRAVKTDPAKAKLEAERVDWGTGRFKTVEITHIEQRAEEIIDRELLQYTADACSTSQNHNACYVFGVCEMFDICHRGAPKESTLFTTREPDYVDACGKPRP